MSFSYKTLSSNDITLTSYIANKSWEVSNVTLSQNGINIFIGENIPVNRNNPYEPINDQKTSNQESRRLIFESIKHLYYESYISSSSSGKFFTSSSFFNYEQTTLASGSGVSTFRNLSTLTGSIIDLSNPPSYDTSIYDDSSSLYDQAPADPDRGGKIVVISIDKNIMGSGLSPNSVFISGSGYYLKDDGEGNIFNYQNELNYAQYSSAIYSEDIYLEVINSSQPQLEYVGNVFYSQGLIVITNSDYLCVFGAPPTAVNDYYNQLNTLNPKILDVLGNDYSDCGNILYDSFLTSPIQGYTFPDFTYDNGIITLVPNQNSVIPGVYKLGYTFSNTSGFSSNTGSINLEITSEPIEITNIISSSNCWGTSSNLPVTFSINYGVPYYSYSLDNGLSYTGSNNLFNVVVSGSMSSSDNNTIYVKDYLENVVTQSFSSWYPGIEYSSDISRTPCTPTSSNGQIRITVPFFSSGISGTLDPNGKWYGISYNSPITFTGLSTGSYTVYVRDSYGCISSSILDITPTPYLTASITQTNTSCYGGSNGYLSIDFINRVDPLFITLTDPQSNYIYNNINLNTFPNYIITASNLSTGSYTLLVTSPGCQSYSNTFNITSPSQILFNTTASYIDSCSNALIFNATGGTSPYTYFTQDSNSYQLYSSDNPSVSLNGLNGGNYNSWVIDSNFCISPIQTIEVYGRRYIYSGSNCETT
jgi:hypothetical protein